jgi:hypothetical protein
MTEPLSLTQAQLACDNVAWFHHTLERVDFWQGKADADPSRTGRLAMVTAWERQRIIAWNKLTPRERRLVSKWTTA